MLSKYQQKKRLFSCEKYWTFPICNDINEFSSFEGGNPPVLQKPVFAYSGFIFGPALEWVFPLIQAAPGLICVYSQEKRPQIKISKSSAGFCICPREKGHNKSF